MLSTLRQDILYCAVITNKRPDKPSDGIITRNVFQENIRIEGARALFGEILQWTQSRIIRVLRNGRNTDYKEEVKFFESKYFSWASSNRGFL